MDISQLTIPPIIPVIIPPKTVSPNVAAAKVPSSGINHTANAPTIPTATIEKDWVDRENLIILRCFRS